MNVIECENITKKYRRKQAIERLSFTIKENTITGLIGRNGAGKTTLLRMIAGFTKETSGRLRVFDQHPFNQLSVSAQTIVIDESMHFPPSICLGEGMKMMEMFYENWDRSLAEKLFAYFSFDHRQLYNQLSKGMKSTYRAIIGIAARAPLTIFDEPTSGMDASVRNDFYRALLKDYLAHPRTIILSSHHLNELEDLLEDILLIDEGKLCFHLPLIDVKELIISLRGKAALIEEVIQGRHVYEMSEYGSEKVAIVKNDFTKEDLERLRLMQVQLSAVSPHDACIYATKQQKGGIDDVFTIR